MKQLLTKCQKKKCRQIKSFGAIDGNRLTWTDRSNDCLVNRETIIENEKTLINVRIGDQ